MSSYPKIKVIKCPCDLVFVQFPSDHSLVCWQWAVSPSTKPSASWSIATLDYHAWPFYSLTVKHFWGLSSEMSELQQTQVCHWPSQLLSALITKISQAIIALFSKPMHHKRPDESSPQLFICQWHAKMAGDISELTWSWAKSMSYWLWEGGCFLSFSEARHVFILGYFWLL